MGTLAIRYETISGIGNLKETDSAVLIDDGEKHIWIPKKLLKQYPNVGDIGDITLPMWLAIEREIA